MNYHNITLSIDDRIYKAINEAYDSSTIESYLESKIGELFDLYVTPEEQMLILADIELEDETNPEGKVALIQIENDSDPVNIACEDYVSPYEIAKVFAEEIFDPKGLYEYTADSYMSNYGYWTRIPDIPFDIMCQSMGKDDRINAIVKINLENDTVSVKGNEDNDYKHYSLDTFYNAAASAIESGYTYYGDRLSAFQEYLNRNELSLSEDNQGMQM